jgi:hypothetical protein
MKSRKTRRTGNVRATEGEEKQALHLAETSDLSPNQARELIREHSNDRRKLEEAARNYKAES